LPVALEALVIRGKRRVSISAQGQRKQETSCMAGEAEMKSRELLSEKSEKRLFLRQNG